MGTTAILGIAIGVGVVVYALSLRGTDETLSPHPDPDGVAEARWWRRRPPPTGRDLGFGPGAAAAPEDDPDDSFVYVPVLAAPDTPWQTRITGVVGLIALVAGAALALALVAYQAGHLINRTIQGFIGH